jgi:hypothetical protein
VIADTAACVRREADRLALLRHAALIEQDSHQADFGDSDRAALAEHHRAAVAALTLAQVQVLAP